MCWSGRAVDLDIVYSNISKKKSVHFSKILVSTILQFFIVNFHLVTCNCSTHIWGLLYLCQGRLSLVGLHFPCLFGGAEIKKINFWIFDQTRSLQTTTQPTTDLGKLPTWALMQKFLLTSANWGYKSALNVQKKVHATCTYCDWAFIYHTSVGGWVVQRLFWCCWQRPPPPHVLTIPGIEVVLARMVPRAPAPSPWGRSWPRARVYGRGWHFKFFSKKIWIGILSIYSIPTGLWHLYVVF